jgi:hypothetical protein
MENYRLLHITLNDPPHFGLLRDTNMTMAQWEMSIVSLKMLNTGRLL